MSLIVVGVDGSQQSRRALDWAIPYAAEMSAAAHAIMVVDTTGLDGPRRDDRLAQAEQAVARLIAEVVAAYRDAPTVTHEVVEGDPTAVLLDATQRADLMVFGSHRMSSLRNPALGTVSLACIQQGACPVLVIPPGAPETAGTADLVPA